MAKPVSRRVLLFRVLFVLLGWGIAAYGLTAFHSTEISSYVAFAILMVLVRFFWVEGTHAFPLPYLATSTAFIYIIGLPSIAIDYAVGTPLFVIQVLLTLRGWLTRSQATHVVQAIRTGGLAGWRAWIDRWAGHTIATVGVAFRYVLFDAVRNRLPASRLICLVAVAEILGAVLSGAIAFSLPLLPSDMFRGQVLRQAGIAEERTDITYAAALLLPLLVCLIFYGFQVNGLFGAVAWSLCTLGPHYLLKLLHERRTSLVESNRALHEVNESLQRQEKEQKDFVYAVTHDLKGPVSAILLTADMALERDSAAMPAETRDDLARITALAGDTEEMIRGLLGMFRIVSEPEPVVLVNFGELIRRVLDTLRSRLTAKQVRVDVGPLPSVWGQRRKLEHVLANLLDNAVKYVPASTGHIVVDAERGDATTLLRVRDNGIGIAPNYHQTIFDLFTRVPSAEQMVDGATVPGTGVGLAIVKQVVEAHQGTVWVESAEGKGSCFCIRLPDLLTRQ